MPENDATSEEFSYYAPFMAAAEVNLLKSNVHSDLYNEIALLRLMMRRTLQKMNEEQQTLTFRDHLFALHAFSRAAGRIAHLTYTQHILFPLLEDLRSAAADNLEALANKASAIEKALVAQGKVVVPELKKLNMELFANNLKELSTRTK